MARVPAGRRSATPDLLQPVSTANQGFGDRLRQEGAQRVEGSLDRVRARIAQGGVAALKNGFNGFYYRRQVLIGLLIARTADS
jgi:predicted ABC-type ATPase